MPLNRAEKEKVIAEVAEVAEQENCMCVVAADYRGTSANAMVSLYEQAREKDVKIRIVKNTLAKRALTGTRFECMNEALSGPLVLLFSIDEPGAAARVARDFAKNHDTFSAKALTLGDGQLLPAESLATVASLPTLDEARARLLSVMQAPIAKFVRTVAEPTAKLARAIAAVRDKKQQEG